MGSILCIQNEKTMRKALPSDMFAYKLTQRPLARVPLLFSMFVWALFVCGICFALLLWFFWVRDTSSVTKISNVRLGGHDCTMLSAMPPSSVTVGFPGKLFSENNGQFIPSLKTTVDVSFKSTYFAKAQDCADDWDSSLCRTPRDFVASAFHNMWDYTASMDITSVLIGSDGVIYVSAFGLYAIDPNGTQRWAFTPASFVRDMKMGAGDVIYLTCVNGNLYALSPLGTLLWSVYSERAQYGSSIYEVRVGFDGTIYTYTGYTVVALSQLGDLKWNATPALSSEAIMYSHVTIGMDNTVYCSNFISPLSSKINAFSPNGTVKWVITADGALIAPPKIDTEGVIYLGLRSSVGGHLCAINPVDGSMIWNFSMAGGGVFFPLIGDAGALYAGDTGGSVYALHKNGTQKWAFMSPISIDSNDFVFENIAIGADGTIVTGSSENLYALNPNGVQKWSFLLDSKLVSTPVVGPNGNVFVVTRNSKLYSFNTNGAVSLIYEATGDLDGLSSWVRFGPNNVFYGRFSRKGMVAFSSNSGIFIKSVDSQESNSFSFSEAVFMPCDLDTLGCSQVWQAQYCHSTTEFGKLLKESFCALFQKHPPYSCSRDERRSLLEAISLSFSFAELGYVIIMVLLCKWLWRRFSAQVVSEPREQATSKDLRTVENSVYRQEETEYMDL